MTLINCADEVILSDGTAAEAVYQGSVLIWPDPTFECLPDLPDQPTMTAFRPVGAYGALAVSFVMPTQPDVDSYRVEYTDQTGAWVVNGPVVVALPGQTITDLPVTTADNGNPRDYAVRVVVFDSFDQSTIGTTGSYSIETTPLVVAADSLGHWRQGQYGYQSSTPERMYQGYFDTASFVYTSYAFYGTKITDACTPNATWGGGKRTVTGMGWRLRRDTAGGFNANDNIYGGTHDLQVNPGVGVTEPESPVFDVEAIGTLAYDDEKLFDLPSGWVDDLRDGVHFGLGLDAPSGKPYLYLKQPSAFASQADVEISHYG